MVLFAATQYDCTRHPILPEGRVSSIKHCSNDVECNFGVRGNRVGFQIHALSVDFLCIKHSNFSGAVLRFNGYDLRAAATHRELFWRYRERVFPIHRRPSGKGVLARFQIKGLLRLRIDNANQLPVGEHLNLNIVRLRFNHDLALVGHHTNNLRRPQPRSPAHQTQQQPSHQPTHAAELPCGFFTDGISQTGFFLWRPKVLIDRDWPVFSRRRQHFDQLMSRFRAIGWLFFQQAHR